MRRSDAFSNALAAVEDEETAYPRPKAECFEVFREAHEAFSRYRAKVGISDPAENVRSKPA